MKKLGLICLVLLLSTNVSAELIDYGSFTTDNSNQLDWLDLDATSKMTMSAALENNSDWRFATNAEVVNLFGQLFDGYTANYCGGLDIEADTISCTQVTHEFFNSQIANFRSLFGITRTIDYGNADVEEFSFGYYIDERGQQSIMGVDFRNAAYSAIYGLNYDSLLTGFNIDPTSGTYLVRSHVPIPAAVWLFSSGLILLVGISKRRKRY